MHSIEVDFEVLKALMARRATESVTYNDVLRGMLNLGSSPKADAAPTRADTAPKAGDWIVKGVRFPAGTEFRGKHNGQTYTAHVEAGALVLNGKRYESPSHAANHGVTSYAVNGWRFWECRLPGQTVWQLMQSFRKD